MRLLFLSTLGFSLAAHVAVAVAIPRAHAGSPIPAPVREVTVDLLPPAPPPPPEPAPEVTPAKHVITYVASAPHQAATPSHREDIVPAPPAAAPSALVAASPELPRFSLVVGSADVGGGGTASAAGTGKGTPPASPTPSGDAREDLGVSVPAYLVSSGRPEYPPEARAAGIEADAQMEIVVDESGRVVESKLLRREGHGFDEAALRAIRNYRFAPAQRDGHPVRVRMRWTVAFRLE